MCVGGGGGGASLNTIKEAGLYVVKEASDTLRRNNAQFDMICNRYSSSVDSRFFSLESPGGLKTLKDLLVMLTTVFQRNLSLPRHPPPPTLRTD